MSAERPSESPLPPECLSLPLVCQEGLKDLLSFPEGIRSWWKFRSPQELEPLFPQVTDLARRLPFDLINFAYGTGSPQALTKHQPAELFPSFFGLPIPIGPKPVEVEQEALAIVSEKMWDKVETTGRFKIAKSVGNSVFKKHWEVVRNELSEVDGARFAGDEIVEVLAKATIWETIKDQPGFEKNLFLPFLRLYELGATRIEFHRYTSLSPTVFIHFPVSLGGKKLLTCLGFNGESPRNLSLYEKIFISRGSEQRVCVHHWADQCHARKPLKTSQKIR